MNRKVNGSILAGALLSAAVVSADVLIEDFSNTNGLNQITGNWIADSDEYPSIGGSSRVLPAGDTSNLVVGEGCGPGCYAGHNIFKAYQEPDGVTVLQTDLKVTAAVPGKNWAYAGWVMNFTKEYGKEPWLLQPWEKGNDVNISSCTHLEITMGFDLDRQLWVSLYNPFTAQANANSPQFGWRYKGTGAVETKRFSLASGGLSGIATKWTDASALPLDLKKITRLQIYYEGQKGLAASDTAPYDAVNHRLTISKVQLLGANCKIIGKDSLGNAKEFGVVGIRNGFAGKRGDLKMSVASGRIQFSEISSMGAVKVTVRSLAGEVVASGDVDAIRSSMDVTGLRNGVYLVQAASGAKTWSNTVTLLK